MPDLKDPAQDEIQALIEKNPCGRCKALKLPVCKCKTGGGAGDGSGKDTTLELSVQVPEQKQGVTKSVPLDLLEELDEALGELTTQDTLEVDLFDLEEMAEFLSFSHDSKLGVITIRPKPGFLLYNEKEIQELLRNLKMVLEQFKIALKNQGIPVDDFTITLNKNELIVRDAFIKELVSRNLLPKVYAPHLVQENQPTRLTPFTTTPTLRSKKEEEKEEEKNEEKRDAEYESVSGIEFNPSPFSFSLTKLFGWRS